MRTFRISGQFSVEIKAESPERALDELDKLASKSGVELDEDNVEELEPTGEPEDLSGERGER